MPNTRHRVLSRKVESSLMCRGTACALDACMAQPRTASACFVFVEHDACALLPHLSEIIESTGAIEVAMGQWGPSTRRALSHFAETETLLSAVVLVGHGDASERRLAKLALMARELVSRMSAGCSTSLTFFVAVNRTSELKRELLAVAETLTAEFLRVAIQIRFVTSDNRSLGTARAIPTPFDSSRRNAPWPDTSPRVSSSLQF